MRSQQAYEYDILLCEPHYEPIQIIKALDKFRIVSSQFHKSINLGKTYRLQEHVLAVLHIFELFFAKYFELNQRNAMRLLLALHDIGKPLAIQRGSKTLQHRFTLRILKRIPITAINHPYRSWIYEMLRDDYLGAFLKGERDIDESVEALLNCVVLLGVDKRIFFHHLSVYYQCDVASYTRITTFSRALDSVFEWNEEQTSPKYDEKSGLFVFSQQINQRYEMIKNMFLQNDHHG